MNTRRAQRRRRTTTGPDFLTRVRRFATGWEGLASLAVLIVLAVLIQGVFDLRLPSSESKPPPRDLWGYLNIPPGVGPKIVYVGDASGGALLDASGARQAVELALQERGSIHGTQVELVVVEDACDSEEAVLKAAELVLDPQVVGVISQACHDSTLAAREVYEKERLPYFSLNLTSPDLTEGSVNTYRMLWNDKRQGVDAALYSVEQLNAGRALLLHDGSLGARETLGAFRSQFRAQRGQIADLRPVDASEKGWNDVLQETETLEVDMVYFAGGGKTAGALLSFLRGNGYEGEFMVTGAAYSDQEYLLAGQVLESTYASTLQAPRSEGYPIWKETYEKAYGPVGTLSPEAYDAATVLLRAVDTVASPKEDGTLEIGRNALRSNMRRLPLQGVTGRADFDPNGDRTSVLVLIMKYEDGEFTQVK